MPPLIRVPSCLALVLACAGWFVSTPAWGETQTVFAVQAVIQHGCLIEGGGTQFGSLGFGTFPTTARGTANASLTPDGTVSLTCTPDTSVTMRIDGGQHYSGTRRLQHAAGSTAVPYRLYSDAGFHSEIGINSNITFTSSNRDLIAALPIFAQLTLPTGAAAGLYHDSLTITLEW